MTSNIQEPDSEQKRIRPVSAFLTGFKKFSIQILLLLIILAAVIIFALSVGRYHVSFSKVIMILVDNIVHITNEAEEHWTTIEEKVVELVRLPRIIVAGLCGASLSITGAAMQGVFRNPLVSPQIAGVSSGAAFGGVLAILLLLPGIFVPAFAFIFGIAALLLTLGISRAGRGSILSLVLGGIVTSSFFAALVSLVKYVADPDDILPTIVYWLMGSYNESRYIDVLYVGIPMITAGLLLYKMRFVINILSLGEEEARSLNIKVDHSRRIILFCSAILVSATVSVSGIVGWVGLVIPHFARMITGAGHERVLPVSILSGAIYMILVDTIARTATQGEIPIGILTALVGAPVFGWLVYRIQMRGWNNA